MKKSSLKLGLLATLIATALWFTGSWWYYTCKIKNTCGTGISITDSSNIKKPVNTTVVEERNSTPEEGNTDAVSISSPRVTDTDNDGLSDEDEEKLGTDPLLKDTDTDGIPDNEEIGVNLDSPLDTDGDGVIDALDLDDDNDGLSTLIEENIGTSALLQDTDSDGVLDNVEVGEDYKKPLDTDGDEIINALDTDDDDDGLETHSEILLGTNYLLADSDGDGLSDFKEIGKLLEEPADADSDGIIDALDTEESKDQDGDGLDDTLEALLNTDPTKKDTDGDGINDDIEVGENTSAPTDTDLDGTIDALDTVDDRDNDNDGLTDAQEKKLGSDSNSVDSDNDGINDSIEIGNNIDDPLDTDEDGILNLLDDDDDDDNLSTRYETRIGTNPLNDDTDGDGLKDDIELKTADSDDLQDTDKDGLINPVDNDDDGDSILTLVEIENGTNPLIANIDNDKTNETLEIASNTNQPQTFEKTVEVEEDAKKKNDAIPETKGSLDLTPVDTTNVTESLNADSENNSVKETTTMVNTDTKQPLESDNDTTASTLNTKENQHASNANETEGSYKEVKTEEKSENTPDTLSLEYFGESNKDAFRSARLFFPYLSSKPSITGDTNDYFTKIIDWLKQSTKNNIRLTGHTDSVGSEKTNLSMGIRRVMVIREILIELGAPMNQIDIISRGESQAIESNDTEKGRLKNRRVEITPLRINTN